MKSVKTLQEISDGKVYDFNDMVKADAGGCVNCSACCHDVGDLVTLTPFDVYEIKKNLNQSFDELLENNIELKVEDKILLPHLKMIGDMKKCSFLNDEERCSIHQYRPNICRLFPLGRFYEEDDFKYFLQSEVCVKPKLGKVKVKKWIDIRDYRENKAFILEWYRLLKALKFRVKFIRDDEELKGINKYLIDTFYRMDVDNKKDFYYIFNDTLVKGKKELGII